MFIVGDKKEGFKIHLDLKDMIAYYPLESVGLRVDLSPDKAKELEDKLEEALKET